MNARELQIAIMEDLDALFADSRFKTPDPPPHQRMAAPKTYAQNLPQLDAQSEEDPFPYIIVRLDRGGIESQSEPHKVSVLLIVGIYDADVRDFRDLPPEKDGSQEVWDTRNFGPMAVMEIMERIQEHYEKQPALDNGNFYFDGPFHWAMQDETSYPYYIGACEMTFLLPAPRQEGSEYT